MVQLKIIGHSHIYEVKELLKTFYNSSEFNVLEPEMDQVTSKLSQDTNEVLSIVKRVENQKQVITKINDDTIENIVESFTVTDNTLEEKRKEIKSIKRGIYLILKKLTKKTVPWGILTGIRPTKIVHELFSQNKDELEISYILKNEYLVNDNKVQLLIDVAKVENKYVYPIDANKISIYISIPFCPTRCTYCSFPSNPINRWDHKTDAYIAALCKEIEMTSKVGGIQDKIIESLYIGGGTPSTLNLEQITRLFNCLEKSFILDNVKEITFEAGRPETITLDKLKLLKKLKVNRLSINPQTMNNCTLETIGRNHTSEQIVQAYKLALEVGFDNINMDVIIGLPNETVEIVEQTMNGIKKLSPTNITVHTLAIKNTSDLKQYDYSKEKSSDKIIDMISLTSQCAKEMDLKPYYMYRQKHMVGNLENVGYSKEGYECIYNIQMIEEKQTIIALGAGAITKVVSQKENRFERVPNVKNLEHYIDRVEEMVERKRKALEE
ncbi:coproporphyrinogen dehydrogenase HemZ [Serpentinicella sp. ANB-PHB4]|uniref:coproporphyrinogen dehydrogenase HemZ n=1 Tax=Serpentinicella sp. ANB-PHB4 TaxID=3074076 RepID=UPI00285FA8AB|nr:coproporphyrinogen dehydrogenase HemZ [Serpentinicella sp. ANB-PHB4]MDR5658072.1 coproporphyrinogen dehydrogenase HemZ [Serpentinicella sp. ANB-PHB4]